jgi:crotonobetainyl-CoA:carnitine CoA-transferase CaiB-like acyl-CoA transferase
VQTTIGNRDVHGRAPFGVYPAKTEGGPATMDDRWIAISCETDEQWAALVLEMGSPAWAQDPKFATNEGRYQHHKELDSHISAWTAGIDDYDLMARLQLAGVSATPVLEASRMFDDPQLLARDFFREQTQLAAGGPFKYVGPMWKFSETPIEFYQPPIMFGEHNDYVYREVLGLSDEEIESLREKRHIATEYDPSVP